METTLKTFEYCRARKYTDLELIYSECSGPGGLQLTEFMAEKMQVRSGARLLDIGIEHGYQTCFLAKEYDLFVVAIDPDDDRVDGMPHIEHLQRNARNWQVVDRVVGLKLGVPDTRFAANTFDFVHSTTTLEMVRGFLGVEYYKKCLAEIYRILRPGGVFGLGEPMHLDVPIPADLAPIYTKGGGAGPEGWAECFATITETAALCREAGSTSTRRTMHQMHGTGGWSLPLTIHTAKWTLMAKRKSSGKMAAAGCRTGMSSHRSQCDAKNPTAG